MTKNQALNILRVKGNTENELKQAYRAACKKYHPDHGGDEEFMKLINEAYGMLKKCEWTATESAESAETQDIAKEVWEKWQKMKTWAKIKGEIVGTWVWVSGETWRYKKFLKEMGFRWSRNKTAWYWHPSGYKKRSGKKFNMDEIRGMFGSQKLDSGTAPFIA